MDLKDKFKGALVGTHVGDALGMPVEGQPPELIQMRFGQVTEMIEARMGAGTYTDDTEMMIAVAESLCRVKGIDGEDMANSFLNNFNPRRGYGRGTMEVLSLIKSGVSWEEGADKVFKGGSYGNGSAMRIAPLGCFYHNNWDKLKKGAFLSSRITHSHPLALEGACLQALAVGKAVQMDPEEKLDPFQFLDDLREPLNPQEEVYQDKLVEIKKLLASSHHTGKVVEKLGNDVRAFNSVPAALYCFLAFHYSFEEALIQAVGMGGDTDTIGAMTGAISGAYHGFKKIPLHWLEELEDGEKGRSYIEKLAEKLYDNFLEVNNK